MREARTDDDRVRLQEFFAINPEIRTAIDEDVLARKLIVDGAIEVCTLGPSQHDVEKEWIIDPGKSVLLPRRFSRLREEWLASHPNEESYPKLSIRSTRPRIVMERTEWCEVQPLHHALVAEDGSALRLGLLPSILDGASIPVPNIAVVHAIVQTSDNKILLTRRSPELRYHPSAWCASLEEQIEISDLEAGQGFLERATARGLQEELLWGQEADPVFYAPLSLFLEFQILNFGIVVFARISADADELQRLNKSGPIDNEVQGLGFMSSELGCLASAMLDGSPSAQHDPLVTLHPTFRYRLLTAAVHLYGVDAVLDVLSKSSSQARRSAL